MKLNAHKIVKIRIDIFGFPANFFAKYFEKLLRICNHESLAKNVDNIHIVIRWIFFATIWTRNESRKPKSEFSKFVIFRQIDMTTSTPCHLTNFFAIFFSTFLKLENSQKSEYFFSIFHFWKKAKKQNFRFYQFFMTFSFSLKKLSYK